ncbi:MAG: HlyD family efflux transporter periplasmic adaptor subunit [Bacteroidota bacterium]
MKKGIKHSVAFFLAITFLLYLTACQQEQSTSPVKKNIEDAVFASGYIEQENNYTVSAKAEGIILSLPVKEGDRVSKHEIIATLESDIQNDQLVDAKIVYRDAVKNSSPTSPQLQHIQSQIDQAKQQLVFDQENYDRYKDLWKEKSVARVDFEKAELQYKASESNLLSLKKNYEETENALSLQLERSQVQVKTQNSLLKDYQLLTQESGQVIQIFKKQGELLRRGEAVARIGSGAYLIKLFVSEEDITKVELGNPLAVNLNTYPGQAFTAKVSKIYPAFDESEQSYVVEARFDKLPEQMFSGTQLQANIQTGQRKDVLLIPTDYISKGNVVTLKGGLEKQIETGSKNKEWTEVVSGITEQDYIIKTAN